MGLQPTISSLENAKKSYPKSLRNGEWPALSLLRLKQHAIHLHHQGCIDEAVDAYRQCLKMSPKDVGLWGNLGAALRKQKHFQSAVNCYRRALELEPKNNDALCNLANALKDLHRFDEALSIHKKLIKARPNNVQALMNYAALLRETGDFERALALLDRAQSMEPNNAGIEWERSQQLLYLGQYKKGWRAFEARWQTGDLPVIDYGVPQWHGQSLQGKRILLHAEQGYGDTIFAARFIKLIKQQGAYVIFQCKLELHRLFQHIDADELIKPQDLKSDKPEAFKWPSIDYHCPLMSLMAPLAIEPATIPPPSLLHVPDDSRIKFKFISRQSSACLNVGIVWSGSITFANNTNRAVSVDKFLPFAEIPGVRLYSLQKGPEQAQLQHTRADCVITSLGPMCKDFADTAAAISELDVIVMTDSSVAHLAASMGKPVINLLQKIPYWLYNLAPQSTPWYPKMTLIKQHKAGEWASVFERAAQQLIAMKKAKLKNQCKDYSI